MEYLGLIWIYVITVASMFKWLWYILLALLALALLFIITVLIQQGSGGIFKLWWYKMLAKISKRYKLDYGVDMSYGIDYSCYVVYVINNKTGDCKVIRQKYMRER